MSNINIEIVNVSKETKQSKTGKAYTMFDVAYKNKSFNDKLEGKKQADFVSKSVTEALNNASFGDIFTVVREKNGEYWEWKDIQKGEMVVVQQQQNGEPMKVNASPSPKSTYETAEERAAKQVMIVRQSSVSSAINALKTDKNQLNAQEVIELAKKFEEYVMYKGEYSFAEFPEDIPV